MSTPKLNVTFWDMPEKPNNGYAKFQSKLYQQTIFRFQRSVPMKSFCLITVLIIICLMDLPFVANAVLPFTAVAGIHFWHAILYRGSLTAEMTHGLFCASVFGEIIGGAAVTGFGTRTVIHSMVLSLTSLFLGQEPTLMMYAFCRLFLWGCVPWVPDMARSFLCYVSSLSGLLAAKYLESFLLAQVLPEVRLTTPRRRRTSNNTLYSVYKVRRTSLPALGGKSSHHPFGFQGSASTVDVALLAEAHGLVTDMLADPQLPAHVVGGLRSLASLLSPPSQVSVNHRIQRPGGASISLADFNSGSDNEEIPYTGEKPSALSKFKKTPGHILLRRTL